MIAGGKLTTYRVMAQRRRRRGRALARPRRRGAASHHRPGAAASAPTGFETRTNQRVALARPVRAARGPDRPPARAGTAGWSTSVLDAGRRRGPSWPSRCPGAEDYLRAEVVYAVTHEGARHLDDVLTRRTRISIETFDRGVAAARAGRAS